MTLELVAGGLTAGGQLERQSSGALRAQGFGSWCLPGVSGTDLLCLMAAGA